MDWLKILISRIRNLISPEGIVLVILVFLFSIGGFWATGVLGSNLYPGVIDDDVYYIARMHTVSNGYFNIGNPYYLEHRLAPAPAFTLPDTISSVPLLLGANIKWAVTINFALWSVVFALLAYFIFYNLDFSKKWSVGLSFFLYSQVYWMIMRPTILQVVWPIVLLFILGLLWLVQNKNTRVALAFITVSVSLAFYFYSFVFQLFGVVLLLLLFYYFSEDRKIFFKLLYTSIFAGLLALPGIISQFNLIKNPLFWETFGRLGLVDSHFPGIIQYNYGRWVFLVLLCWYVLRRRVESSQKTDIFIYVFGLGLIIANWSNILTGKDYHLGLHVGLFITLYLAIAIILLLRLIIKNKYFFSPHNKLLKVVVFALLILLSLNILSNFQRSLPWKQISKNNLTRNEKIEGVISWFNSRPENDSVVLSDDNLSMYLAMYTMDYSLYSPAGHFGMMPSAEATERYLISRALQKDMTIKQLSDEIVMHAGQGEAARLDNLNIKNIWCSKYRLDILVGMFCYPEKTMIEYKGQSYWNNLFKNWVAIKSNLVSFLEKYNVKYLVLQKDNLASVDIMKLPKKVVWKNDNYIIYEMDYKN